MTLAVGFFDGVHRGHQAILSEADAALTFREHPLTVLNPSRAPARIMSLDERLAAIRACGVKTVHVWDFTPEVAAQSPEQFVECLRQFCPSHESLAIRAGENWRFGCGGRGDAEFLRAQEIPVTVVPYAVFKGEKISSTRIRSALSRGELEDVAEMLGRPWQVSGEVVRGKGVGRTIGRPTMNLSLAGRVLLPCGVYAVEVAGRAAVANYGVAPTMGERAWKEPVFEIHFPFDEPPATPHLTVAVRRFIRPEKTFASLDELKAQIAQDILACRS